MWGCLAVTLEELEERITQLRARPLMLLCRTKSGKAVEMAIRERVESRSAFLYVVCDDLDRLLEAELPRIEITE